MWGGEIHDYHAFHANLSIKHPSFRRICAFFLTVPSATRRAYIWGLSGVWLGRDCHHENRRDTARHSRNQTIKTFTAEAAEVRRESTSMTVPEAVFSGKTVSLRSSAPSALRPFKRKGEDLRKSTRKVRHPDLG